MLVPLLSVSKAKARAAVRGFFWVRGSVGPISNHLERETGGVALDSTGAKE